MPYLKTVKYHRIFKDNVTGKYYCFDKINRRSVNMDSEKELIQAINDDTVQYKDILHKDKILEGYLIK